MQAQEILHAFEMRGGKKWVWRATIAVVFFAFALLYFVMQFRGLNSMEAMDEAQLAAQLVRGKGYTTQFIRPSAIAQIRTAKSDSINLAKMPEITQPPLYPAILGLLFKVSGTKLDVNPHEIAVEMVYPPERLIVAFNFLCMFLTALVILLWAERMFDERVAFISAAAFVSCDLIWQLAVAGFSSSLTLLLVTCMMASLHEILLAEDQKDHASLWFWTGISALFLLLAIYSRLALLWLAAPYFIFLFILYSREPLLPLMALFIVLIGITPWLYRNEMVSGSMVGGTFYLMQDGSAQDYPERTFAVADSAQVKSWIRSFPKKVLYGVRFQLVKSFELLGASSVIALFGAGLLHPFRRSRIQKFRFFILMAAFFLMMEASVFKNDFQPIDEMNQLILVWPAIGIFGAAFFYVLLDRIEFNFQILRQGVIGLFLFIGAIPLLVTLTPPRPAPYHYPPYFPPMIKAGAELIGPDEFLMSDMPWATAWYGNRCSLWLTKTVEDFYSINDSVHAVNALLITPITGEKSLTEIDRGDAKGWASLIRQQSLPQGFPLQAFLPLPPNKNEYSFFSDHVRW